MVIFRVHNLRRHPDFPPRAEVDGVKRVEHHVGHREPEWPTCGVSQRDLPLTVVTSDLDREPPFAVCQTVGGNEAAKPVPVQIVAAVRSGSGQRGEFRESLGRHFAHQVCEQGRSLGDFHGQTQKTSDLLILCILVES